MTHNFLMFQTVSASEPAATSAFSAEQTSKISLRTLRNLFFKH
jgi:hypothetical protein